MSRHIVARGLAFAVALACPFVVASCHLTLGVDDYKSIAKAACSCPESSDYVSNCEEQVATALAEGNAKEVEMWIGFFQTLSCDDCEFQLSCLVARPVCREQGEPCSAPLDCCDVITEPGVAYCVDGVCTREPPTCAHTFETCQTDADCCGSEAGLGFCVDNDDKPKICLEYCAPGVQNCPGCCAGAELPGVGPTALCLGGDGAGGLDLGANCELACIQGVIEECEAGSSCQSVLVPNGDGASLQLCRPDG